MKKKKKLEQISLAYRAQEAFKEAVAEALVEHRRHGIPIAVWRDGKVVRVPADQIEVRENSVEYVAGSKKRK